jgi:hypothetical protein
MKKKELEKILPIVNESNNVTLNEKWKELWLFVLQEIPNSITQFTYEGKLTLNPLKHR